MTPGARVAAAIEILDRIAAGEAAERALTLWARGSRFAGSGDRVAVRDHVFDALRCWRSYAALGGAETGRGRMLGAVRAAGQSPGSLFTGLGHAPPVPTPAEAAHMAEPVTMTRAEALDCPDWLLPDLERSLGADAASVLGALRLRAPVVLRVNAARSGRDEAAARLAAEGIATRPHALAATALEVTGNARKLMQSQGYAEGLVELQDAASQAVVTALEPLRDVRVLDYCAGGGGKALAMAALGANVWAHDVSAERMRDLPQRAARAGVSVPQVTRAEAAGAAPFELVLVDAPCSGSGSWRRSPEAKWRLTPDRLAQLQQLQAQILDEATALVAPGGRLAYATCSLLAAENDLRIDAFLAAHPGWRCVERQRWTPLEGGDGFFLAILTRA